MDICRQVLSAKAPRISERVNTGIPPEFDQLMSDCLATDPEKRPESAAAMIEILDTIPMHEKWGQKEAEQWWKTNKDKIHGLKQSHENESASKERSAATVFVDFKRKRF